ncbi:TonB-dependent receptor [Arenibacter algicola]|uniref:SusC/RagA family TonB-linked outer membrane protein n=1 Tax=Arenibacter algicola TaxID=616991 RepID=UPI001C0757A3|nr:TonB-dependent receptor [Arenibacter algicola]MBU2906697.1 TonB-dependent receptor [Arenibacter algicola]
MKKRKILKFCNLFLMLFLYLPFYAQEEVKVTGNITALEDGEPLPGVTVVVKGTSNGTTTDFDGNYSIITEPNAILVFTFLGFERKEEIVGGRFLINVAMNEDVSQLSEVVVVGYGTQNKRDVTGAMAQIDAEKLSEIPVPSVAQQLQGRLAGVQINENSGEPGGAMTFRIRGAASINAGNSPLIVIDGFPTTSGLEALSPNEIESISVLKDASASSLYGSRAANGVILITTKQAKQGQKSIEFSSYVGVQTVSEKGRPDLMNAREFAQFKKEYYEDAALYEGYTGGVPEEYANPEQYGPNDGTDWFDVLLRDAMTQNYNLTMYTGAKDLKSVINLGYNNEEGVILNSYSNRYTARANNIYDASDKLKIGVNLSVSHIRNQVIPGIGNGRNILANAFNMDPTIEYKNEDGTYPIAFSRPGMFPNPNYYLVVTQRKNPRKETTVLANLFGEYEVIDGLKYKLSINANTRNGISRSFTPSTARGGLGSAPPQPAIGSYGTDNFQNWLVENTLNYQKTINKKHNLEALAGYTAQNFYFENSSINASEFPDDNIEWINVATTRIGNAGTSESSLLSYLGRLNYNYDSKYLISLAFRRDGSSRFGSNTKWGNFPSISAGWVISDENFLKGIEDIQLLKLRASYGKVGNNNIGDYTYLASLNNNNYVLGGQVVAGRSLNGIGNSNLTWETTTSYNVGLDLDLFGGRISFTYDYYWKKTDGLLYGIDIPIQSGFNNITSNIGEFNFWGHEFSAATRNLVGKLKWDTNFNISFDRNKVIKLGTNDAPIGGYNLYWDDNRTAVGNPIGLFYGYINTGVYMTQEEFDTQPHGATSMVGTARFQDISGPDGVPDGIIDSNDRTYIGDPNPDFIYGMTNSFSYGDFDLSIVTAGTVGNDIADDHYQSSENFDAVFNVRKGYADRWRSLENPGSGYYPRTRAGTTADYRNFTNRQVFKGTYLAVKNITLGYNIPLPDNKFMKSARVNFSAQNPFIFTKYPGMNPEVGIAGLNGLNQGRDFTSYPISKIYTLGLNFTF